MPTLGSVCSGIGGPDRDLRLAGFELRWAAMVDGEGRTGDARRLVTPRTEERHRGAVVLDQVAQRVVRRVAATPVDAILPAFVGSRRAGDPHVVSACWNSPNRLEFAALRGRELFAPSCQFTIGHTTRMADPSPRLDESADVVSGEARVCFEAFGVEGYELFLRCKRMPESDSRLRSVRGSAVSRDGGAGEVA